jgi:hypothetical protein
MAKKLDPAAHSNGVENFDSELQLPAYQNERVHLRLSPGEERNLFQHWQLIFQKTKVALGCQALLKYEQPDDVRFPPSPLCPQWRWTDPPASYAVRTKGKVAGIADR